jgi:endonuclease/exonuclease/phosphatase family metal-dependent hydrolase
MHKPALVLALAALTLTGISHVSAMSSPPAHAPGAAYTVLQMNLCLSGEADCYGRTAYPSVVAEATAEVRRQAPSAVTLNEACSADAAEIARRTGYRLRFAAITYRRAPIPCVDPGGRGVFGLAVLAKHAISSAHDRAFTIQASGEQRRWLCVTTVRSVTVCTAHLVTRDSTKQRVANDAECRELHDLLARRQRDGVTVFGGDLNRQRTCAPATMWTSRDSAATQAAGVQHIYSSVPLDTSSLRVAAATYTDHDFMFAAGNLMPTVSRSAWLF